MPQGKKDYTIRAAVPGFAFEPLLGYLVVLIKGADVQKKTPYFIDWVITDRCNLECRHCRGASAGGIHAARALSLVGEIAALQPQWLIIEGGEPLLRSDIFRLLEQVKSYGLEVFLITNGMLLSNEVVARLKHLAVRVMISIDGASKTTYESIRHGASFEKVLDAAGRSSQEGVLAAVNFTVLRRNYREIPEIMKLAAWLKSPKVNFIGLKPCHNYQEELLTAEEYREAITLTCQSAQKYGVDFFFDEPFFWPAVKEWGLETAPQGDGSGIVVPRHSACIFGEYLFIEPDGSVKPCSFARYILGNVNSDSLESIWRSSRALHLLRSIRQPSRRNGKCRSCQYLEQCYGCRSRSFAITGSWHASDPACPV
jgi:radical SAM protein with 4Fe4S-binding SPASM domain